MIRRVARLLPAIGLFSLLMLAWFKATAFAATQISGDESSVLDIVKAVYEAFASKNYGLTGSLVVILVCALLKRYAPGKLGKFFHTDAGGSLLVLAGSAATASAAAFAVPGAHLTWSLIRTALMVGLTAAGGYAALKNLLVDPILRPLAAKAPAWAQPIFGLIFFAFDKVTGDDGAAELAKAEKAGSDAVAANPAGGAAAIAGEPEKF